MLTLAVGVAPAVGVGVSGGGTTTWMSNGGIGVMVGVGVHVSQIPGPPLHRAPLIWVLDPQVSKYAPHPCGMGVASVLYR